MNKSSYNSDASFSSEEGFEVKLVSEPSSFGRISLSVKFWCLLFCSVTGIIVQMVSIYTYAGGSPHESSFALMFSGGMILNFLGSFFLATPMGHLKSLNNLNRIVPMSLYILLTLLTFLMGILGLMILFLFVLVVL